MQGPALTVLWQWVTICQAWPLSDCRCHRKTDLWWEQRLIQQWGSAGDCLHSLVWLRMGWEELTPLPQGMLTEVWVSVCASVCAPTSVCWRLLMIRSEEGADDDVWGGGFVFTIHYLQGGITQDKGCLMPFKRRKTNTSRPYKYCRSIMNAVSLLSTISNALSACLNLFIFLLCFVIYF